MAAKSLLRQIRDKESDLGREMDQAVAESRKLVEDAQKEAEGILLGAERDGAAAAEAYLRQEREKLAREIASLRERGLEERAAVEESANARMPRAVENIVNAVTLR